MLVPQEPWVRPAQRGLMGRQDLQGQSVRSVQLALRVRRVLPGQSARPVLPGQSAQSVLRALRVRRAL